ncbi:g4791 [Coccomyxa elongata]
MATFTTTASSNYYALCLHLKDTWRPLGLHKCRVKRRLRCSQSIKAEIQPGADGQLPPWLLGFQCNERYLKWGDSAQTQLLKIYAARELRKDVPWVDEQLAFLSDTLPDLVNKLSRMKAGLLLELVEDTQAVANKMVQLKALLPSIDTSLLVAGCPSLLVTHDIHTLEENFRKLRGTVEGRANVERLVEREPMLLLVSADALVAEAERLLPSGQDPVAYLVANPGTLLDMQQAGLPSAIDGNLWTKTPAEE